jgi:hypothetical protein|tara:strand:+ start:174 stop:593 length:420 start_codon:yes stop_codon:yes gene_type:complete
MKNIFIALLFIANISYANNELVGKWVMIDECSFLNKGDMNTKYCQSQLGINRESYIIYNEDGTYSDYYKNLDWERSLFDIDYSDYTEGTYTIKDGFLQFSDKAYKGKWHVTIDNNVLTIYNAGTNKMAHYKKETLYASR